MTSKPGPAASTAAGAPNRKAHTMADTTQAKLQALADLILTQSRERLARLYSQEQADAEQVEVKPGPKYTKIDRGPAHNMSGMLMIENTTGIIYGIKGYGKVHRGHCYGTLDTIAEYYWGDYYPRKVTVDPPKGQTREGLPEHSYYGAG